MDPYKTNGGGGKLREEIIKRYVQSETVSVWSIVHRGVIYCVHVESRNLARGKRGMIQQARG